jgi:AmmeMemoRadiSam system protein B
MKNLKIRQDMWAGQFYPASPGTLDEMMSNFLDSVPVISFDGGLIVGLIVPHAGYSYSGQTAAFAYKQIENRTFDKIVILAPSHVDAFKGVSVYDGDRYQTVLGQIPVDVETARALTNRSADIFLSDHGHRTSTGRSEHSLEVQLPFLQKVLSNEFKLVPIVFHDYRHSNCQMLGESLADVLDPNRSLVIASSDLYHGYSYEECQNTDRRTLTSLQAFDPVEFIDGTTSMSYQACGAGPIAALLYYGAKIGAGEVKLLSQTNSADVTGQRGGWTVGYASLAVVK